MKHTLCLLMLCVAAAACNGTDPVSGVSKVAAGSGAVVKLGKLSAAVPASWKEEKAGQLRDYTFRLPKVDGDTEDADLGIFFFESGGSVADNIARWKSQFAAPQGKTIDEATKVEKFKVGGFDATSVDIAGTYLFKNPGDAKAKAQKKTDFRQIAVIFESPAGQHVLRLTGPARTVEQHKKSYNEWLKSFK